MNDTTLTSGHGAEQHAPDPSPILENLAKHPFLQGLKTKHLDTLAACAMQKVFEPGEIIFREGHPANRFYLLTSGKVSLETADEQGPTEVQTIGAGDVLGWSWLFPPHYWRFDAVALEPTRATFIYGTRLRELCEEDHDLGYEIMKRTAAVVIQRLTAARKQLARIR